MPLIRYPIYTDHIENCASIAQIFLRSILYNKTNLIIIQRWNLPSKQYNVFWSEWIRFEKKQVYIHWIFYRIKSVPVMFLGLNRRDVRTMRRNQQEKRKHGVDIWEVWGLYNEVASCRFALKATQNVLDFAQVCVWVRFLAEKSSYHPFFAYCFSPLGFFSWIEHITHPLYCKLVFLKD